MITIHRGTNWPFPKDITTMNYDQLNAYALGYYNGRSLLLEDNKYHDEQTRGIYQDGYNKGVADYCALDASGPDAYEFEDAPF